MVVCTGRGPIGGNVGKLDITALPDNLPLILLGAIPLDDLNALVVATDTVVAGSWKVKNSWMIFTFQ